MVFYDQMRWKKISTTKVVKTPDAKSANSIVHSSMRFELP